MRVSLIEDDQISRVVRDSLRTCTEMKGAVAWVSDNDIVDLMTAYPRKISSFVVGTHLHHSHPSALKKLLKIGTIKYIPPTGRLFHPKLYIFCFAKRVSVLIGSHNLTTHAFAGRNIELSALIEGTTDDSIIRDAIAFADETWSNPPAQALKKDFIDSYSKQRKKVLAARTKLEDEAADATDTADEHGSPLDLNWPDYVRAVENDRFFRLPDRLNVLEEAGRLLRGNRSFAQLTQEERKSVSGVRGEVDGLDWGWFGSMVGHGDFVNLIQDSPADISRALAHIPRNGDVSEAQYDAYAQAFRYSFRNRAHGPRIASPSRLLAMKRPDQFVCVDGANGNNLCGAFGVSYTTLNLDNYWDRIIVPVRASSWWRHPRPAGQHQRRIWAGRVALLDSIYYEPT